jgi:hypothetical protein
LSTKRVLSAQVPFGRCPPGEREGRETISKPFLVAVAVFALLAGACTTASGSPARANTPAPRSPVLTPNPSAKSNLLRDVIARSAKQAWAVGTYRNNVTKASDTLILNWDGTSWSKVKSPNPSATANELSGVSAVTSTDAWAVGYYANDANGAQDTLILHWNGTSWSQIPSPNPSATYNTLNGVSADSATDAWAVGTSDTSVGQDALILHWDGTSWSQVTSPNASLTSGALFGVSADTSTDAWAVGFYSQGNLRTLILHWDGTNWSQVASPNQGTRRNELSSVSAGSSTDAWAVGEYRNITTRAFDTMILHWDGTQWLKAKSPNPSPTYNILSCVSIIGPRNGWAVGVYVNAKPAGRTLILHWDGKGWSKVKSPNPSAKSNELIGVSARSAEDAWAVGDFKNHTTIDSLVLHWNGTSWSKT